MRRSPFSSYGSAKSAVRRLSIVLTICAVFAAISLTTVFATGVSAGSITQLVAGLFSPALPAAPSKSNAVAERTGLSARSGHTATLMRDGRVLIVGGDETGSAQIFDPVTGEFADAGFLRAARTGHAATLLGDGRILITGGSDRKGNSLNSTEIFSDGLFTAGPDLRKARAGHTVTVLDDGQIVVIGGNAREVEVIDAAAKQSRIVKGLVTENRAGHSARLLKDGTIIVVGGRNAEGEAALAAERIDPRTMKVETIGSLRTSRIRPELNELPDGKVQIIGGNNEGTMEIYSPETNRFSGYGHVIPNRDVNRSAFRGAGNRATLDGASDEARVLRSASRTALISNGEADDSPLNRRDFAAVKLDGKTIILGGVDSNGVVLNTTLETPETEATVTTDQVDYSPGDTVHITGTGWEPGETVSLVLVRDRPPVGDGETETITLSAVADDDGNIANSEYLVVESDLNSTFVLTATGQTSGRTAQTTFTDGSVSAATLQIRNAACTIATTAFNINDTVCASGSVTVNGGGTTDYRIQWYSTTATTTATPVYDDLFTQSAAGVYPFSITKVANSVGTGTWTVLVCKTSNAGSCSAGNTEISRTFTVAGTFATTLVQAVPTPATQTFGAPTAVTLSATLTRTSGGTAVSGASVTFTIMAPGGGTTSVVGTTDGSGIATASHTPSSGVGTYNVTATFAGAVISGTTYTASTSAVQSFAVIKANQTITFGALPTKTYGDPAFTVSATASSGLTVSFAATGNCTSSGLNGSTITITGAGSCTVTASQAGNTNYNAAPSVPQTFTINPKVLTITANNDSKTYGDVKTYGAGSTAFTTGVGQLVSGDSVTSVTLSSTGAPATASATTYPIIPSAAVGVGLANYAITYVNGTLTVNKAVLNVNADNKSKTYGQLDPTPSYTFSGFTGGDTGPSPAGLAGSAGCTIGAHSENAGTYTSIIVCTAGTLSSTNYTFATGTAGNLTINPATLTVTADAQSKTYGSADPALTFVASGFQFSDTAATVLTGGLTRAAGETVGTYAIGQGTLAANSNYTISFTGATFTINPKLATVSAVDNGKVYGSPEPSLVTTNSGFLTADLGVGKITFSASRAAGETVATYPITASASDAGTGLLNNYSVTFTGATFTITPKAASVTPDPNSKVYGNPDPALTGTLSGFLTGDGVTATYSRTPGETVTGSPYTISATLAPANVLSNYNITYNTAAFNITPKAASVTPDLKTKVYGDSDPALTGTLSGFLAGDGVTAAYTRTAGETVAAGPYTITATLAPVAVLSNYSITYNTANFTITKRPATWTTNPNIKTYGNSDPVGLTTGSGSNFVPADGVTATYSRVAGENASPPTYHITATLTATPMSKLDNYDITNAGAEFTINKRPATWTTNANSKFYGQVDPSPLTTGSGNFLAADMVTASYSRAAGSNVGPYAITATLSATPMSALNNYTITNLGNTFTINPDPTLIVPDTKVSGIINDCTTNTYTATLKDNVTNQGLSGVNLKMTIGTQTATATTNASGVATFALILTQAPGAVTQTFALDQAWGDTNRIAPTPVSRSFTIIADPNVGPGINSGSLYTGSMFFWTTSSSSSTATLTLSATVRDTFAYCPGDITKAKVSFYVGTNGPSGAFSPVSNAQNLPVGLVNPGDTTVGTASAISQYNIGNDQSVTIWVRVVVGGNYILNTSEFDAPVTIGKPGAVNSLMGGGEFRNDGNPYSANGYLGLNSFNSVFGSQVQYNKSGTNPQGKVTVTVHSCNKADGTLDTTCVQTNPSTWHTYFIKSNSISEMTRVNGAATFGSKVNVSEITDGTSVGLDSGNSMQLIFTPYNMPMPVGTYRAGYGTVASPSNKCNVMEGCGSIVIFRSAGGVWYSSSWGAPHNSATPVTVMKNVLNGTLFVN